MFFSSQRRLEEEDRKFAEQLEAEEKAIEETRRQEQDQLNRFRLQNSKRWGTLKIGARDRNDQTAKARDRLRDELKEYLTRVEPLYPATGSHTTGSHTNDEKPAKPPKPFTRSFSIHDARANEIFGTVKSFQVNPNARPKINIYEEAGEQTHQSNDQGCCQNGKLNPQHS